MLPEFTRRTALGMTAATLAAPLAVGALAQPVKERSKPEKPQPAPSRDGKSGEGRPVSETAAAQKGEPKIPEAPKKKIRFAVAGLGKLAVEELLPAFRQCELGTVTALVSGDADKARSIASVLEIDDKHIYDYTSMDRLASDGEVDAVYVVTPNAMHKRDTLAAARAGKHVLCEKPMAVNEAECREMIEGCRSAGRKLMIAYRVHYEPLNNRIRQMLRDRKYGAPRFVTFDAVQDVGGMPQQRLDVGRAGGGSLIDIGIYALNTTRWLLGEEPVEVKATTWNDPKDPRFREVEENIAFHLHFPSGCIASCTSSYGTTRVNRYRAICEKGWVGMEPATLYRGLRAEHGDEESSHKLMGESCNQFAAEIDHFARCILEDREPDTPGEEGLRDVRLMHAIYEAARTGNAVKV